MAFWRHKSNQLKPDYTGLEIQTAANTLPIPIVYGRQKVSGNVIWYDDFIALAQKSGGGGKGGGGGQTTGYNYYVNFAMALCEGPIGGINVVYKDQSLYLYQWLGLTFYNGSTPQTAWSGFLAGGSEQLLSYQGTAFVAAQFYNLGGSGSLGNHNFEILGLLAGTGINGVDADPAQVVYDFLTNGQYGAGFDAANINGASLFGAGGDASMQTYCRAMGLAISPALTSQEPASSALDRWLKICNCAAVWSGGMLAFVPYGDSAISAGASSSRTAQFSIPTPIAPNSTVEPMIPAAIPVASAAQFVSDGGVVYASTGVALVFLPGVTIPTAAGTYGCVGGTYYFAPPDEGKPVSITYTVQTIAAFSPNLTPVYALGDNHFIDEKGNKDPLQVERSDIFSLPTIQRVEVSNRSNWYSAAPVEARDQAAIELYGARVGPVIQAHEVCDPYTMAPTIAQTALQRELYVRQKFTFKLGWEFCLLDPMDIVTITDAGLGLSNFPVRIVSIEEDDRGLLAVTAEELVAGVSTPAWNPTAVSGAGVPNRGAPAWPVNAPLIWEPPLGLTGGAAQLWLGASGEFGATLQWGGAYVWLSLDGISFTQLGAATITQPIRQGVLTAALAQAAGWDTANTVMVSLALSGATLDGAASRAAVLGGATLALVDNELLGYQTATLTGANAYALTSLLRGMNGTSPAAHGAGRPFWRLDEAVVRYDLPANFIGQTLWLKFQSFNAFGGGVQDLSTCVAYTVTPFGAGVAHPIAAQLLTGIPLDLGAFDGVALTDDFGSVAAAVTGAVDCGTLPSLHPIAVQLLTGSPLDLGAVTSTATLADDFGAVGDPVADSIDLGTTASGGSSGIAIAIDLNLGSTEL